MPKISFSARVSSVFVLLFVLLSSFAFSQGRALAASDHSLSRASKHAVKVKRVVKRRRVVKARVVSASAAQGMFDNCDLGSALSVCEGDLAAMSASGLKVVVATIGQASEADLSAYAAAAQSDGMSVMWQIDDPGFWGANWFNGFRRNDFPQFADAAAGVATGTGTVSSAALSALSSGQVLNAMISFLSSLPGTYGYYAADDSSITAGETAGLASYVSEIKAVDPSHMVMVGSSPAQGQSNAGSGAVVGNEVYPQTTRNLANQSNNLAVWGSVQQQITKAQSSATRNGQDSAFILQAFTFGDNLSDGEAVGVCTPSMSSSQCASLLLYPNQQTQTELRNEVLRNSHAKLILWFNYENSQATGNWTSFTDAINAPAPTITATAARAHTKKHATKK